MRRHRTNLRSRLGRGLPRYAEQGIVIALLAVAMLFVIGAIAAIAIDVVTFYTARSEAQLAADGAALAGARVIANSGLTSTNAGPIGAEASATAVAKQVAQQSLIGGASPTSVSVAFSVANDTNPTVTVTVQSNLPTFFARILGTNQVTVAAKATAEAYNPSGASALSTGGTATPVAPLCVKPWLLPNIDPTQNTPAGLQIFDPGTGAILNPALIGQGWPNTSGGISANTNGLFSACSGNCTSSPIPLPLPGEYYPGAIDPPASQPAFTAPTQALPGCSGGFRTYQLAVAGCVPQPISCGVNSATNPSAVNIDTSFYGPRDAETLVAAECLIHYNGALGDSDSLDESPTPFSVLIRNP